jgi:phage-related protein
LRRIKYINPANVSIEFGLSPYLITELDGLDLSTLTIQEQKSPFQDGSVQLDRLFEPRDIKMKFSIEAFQNFTAINTHKREIISALNPKHGVGRLEYTNDNGTWWTPATPTGPVFPNKPYLTPWQEGAVIFYCNDPYWYEMESQSVSMQTLNPGVTFPLTFLAAGITLSNYVAFTPSVQNLGDWTAPIQIQIIGACLNPKLLKSTTGEYVRIVGNLAAGDLIEIDTTPGNKTVWYTPFGGSRVNGINMLDTASTFFSLDPGVNTLAFTDDTPSSTKQCFISWTHRYIGV